MVECRPLSSATTTFDLFRRALKESTEADIARALGLHPNTVARWRERQLVPGNYHYDFLRLIGQADKFPAVSGNAARDKDQFYTKPNVAKNCVARLFDIAESLEINLSAYHFIEPSAGCGWFFEHLPVRRRTGVDIEPNALSKSGHKLLCRDYLQWRPSLRKKNYVVVGNPPFGLRGHLALQFINHSASFADMTAFILPQLFESDGKGVPGKRVVGYQLAHSEPLPADSFEYPNGRPVNVSTVFQVWTKINTEKIRIKKSPTCDKFIKIYSLSDGGTPASTRNKKMLEQCDVYLPSTCFSGMKAYADFEALPNRRGYGVVIHDTGARPALRALLMKHKWGQTAFSSTNGALNLRSSLIKNVVVNAGYVNGGG